MNLITQNPISNFKSISSNLVKEVVTPEVSEHFIQSTDTKLGLALAGLAVLGMATIVYKKTKPITFEKALEKAGVQIKDGIATVKETGKYFSGKIQRFETHSSKETTKFNNGVISEKLYHSITGKERKGEFYKNGKLKLQVTGIGDAYAYTEYGNSGMVKGDGLIPKNFTLFEVARDMMTEIK